MAKFSKLFSGDDGASMIEYGLLIALIAIACVASITAIGPVLAEKFTTAGSALHP